MYSIHEVPTGGGGISGPDGQCGRMNSSRWDQDVVLGGKKNINLGTVILLEFGAKGVYRFNSDVKDYFIVCLFGYG